MGWTSAKPLRVVTGYNGVARRFFEERGFDHVVLLSADGALEAAPAMGSADIILDLVRCVGVGWVGWGGVQYLYGVRGCVGICCTGLCGDMLCRVVWGYVV